MHAELVVGDKINLSKHSGCILEPYMGRFMLHSTVSKHYKDCEHYKIVNIVSKHLLYMQGKNDDKINLSKHCSCIWLLYLCFWAIKECLTSTKQILTSQCANNLKDNQLACCYHCLQSNITHWSCPCLVSPSIIHAFKNILLLLNAWVTICQNV